MDKILEILTATGNAFGWILNLILVLLIYLTYNLARKTSASIQTTIKRWEFIRAIEKDIANLHSLVCVIRDSLDLGGNVIDEERIEFRALFSSKLRWGLEAYDSPTGSEQYPRPKRRLVKESFYWLVCTKETDGGFTNRYWVASKGLHDLLLWFRHVDRAMKENVISQHDLLDWWRQIFPTVMAGRTEYFRNSFQGGSDLAPLYRVSCFLIAAISQSGNLTAKQYVNTHLGTHSTEMLKPYASHEQRQILETLESGKTI